MNVDPIMSFLATRALGPLSVLAALTLLGCREPTQVKVELSTDIQCSDRPLTGISVGALSELESRPVSTETPRCDPVTGRIGSIVLVPESNKEGEFAIRVVTGMTMTPDDCVRSGYMGGCVVARRVLRFVPHETLELPIVMEASCLDVPCGKTETCRSGSCVSATLTNPQECSMPGGCDASPAGSGGSAGSDSNGGKTNAEGGDGGTAGSASGSSSGGASGTPGSGGAGATAGGGTTGTSGGSSSTFTPACTTTSAGIGIYKGLACTAKDPQLCYWPCGPLETGHRSETCTSGAYVEGGCQFPADTDYSCFKVPQADSAKCPATPPQSGQPCSIATCSLPCTGSACEMCGIKTGYYDSSGAFKTGYCVCSGTSSGNHWSCASTISWPCPAGKGC